MRVSRAISVAAVLIATQPAWAQQADVTFFVIGKHASFVQDLSGQREAVDYSFFAEIFLTNDGDASKATLILPGGERLAFQDQRLASGGEQDNLLAISGEARYPSFAALQARYPDGKYKISFKTPSGRVSRAPLLFTEDGLPEPPRIALAQNGGEVCASVDPNTDLDVSWSGFKAGGADSNGILDDLIFVILADPDGIRVAHSGRPFEGGSFLTYADTHFTVPAAALQPNKTYTLSVEHAILDDTREFSSVPAMTTRAVTTNLELGTAMDTDKSKPCLPGREIPSIDSQTVMFYYKDLDAAARFYGDVLGLEQTLDWTWVKFYKTAPGATVGLVTAGEGAYHPVRKNNSVMLSLVTSDVNAWYERLKKTDAKFLKPIADGGGIRSFLLEDPGGYTVEFYQWLESPEQ